MADRKDWIIAVSSSDGDGASLTRFYGSEDEIKKLLLSYVRNDRSNDDDFDYGTEELEHIESDCPGMFRAYSVFSGYHIDYVAQEFATIDFVNHISNVWPLKDDLSGSLPGRLFYCFFLVQNRFVFPKWYNIYIKRRGKVFRKMEKIRYETDN